MSKQQFIKKLESACQAFKASLAEARLQMAATHAQLVACLQSAPEDQFTQPTPCRHRLRLETTAHYNLHACMISDRRDHSGL